MSKLGFKTRISLAEIKPVSVVEHVEIWQFVFAKVVQEHILGAVGSTHIITYCRKFTEIGRHSTKLLQKQKGCSSFET